MHEHLTWLEAYLSAHCDGDWEHEYGIQITSTDNPGWHVRIDLAGTEFEDLQVEGFNEKRSESDWVIIGRKDDVLFGSGGAKNLSDILKHIVSILS